MGKISGRNSFIQSKILLLGFFGFSDFFGFFWIFIDFFGFQIQKNPLFPPCTKHEKNRSIYSSVNFVECFYKGLSGSKHDWNFKSNSSCSRFFSVEFHSKTSNFSKLSNHSKTSVLSFSPLSKTYFLLKITLYQFLVKTN